MKSIQTNTASLLKGFYCLSPEIFDLAEEVLSTNNPLNSKGYRAFINK